MKATWISKLITVSFFVILVPMGSFIVSSIAETKYVSDLLIIALREGPGMEHTTITTLRSDTPLEIIEENEPFLKVKTTNGVEGWVLGRYLSDKTPKPIIISTLNKSINQLENRIATLEKQKISLTEELKIAKRDYAFKEKELNQTKQKSETKDNRIDQELKAITEKYNTLHYQSNNVVELANEKESLAAENQNFRKENTILNTKVENLEKQTSRQLLTGLLKWFLAGAGVILLGILIGRLSKQKKDYYKY